MQSMVAIQYLSEVLSAILRREAGCGKMQYTSYGKCTACKNSELCQKIDYITPEDEE